MAKRKDASSDSSSSASARPSRRRLGRGLSSLMSSPVPITPTDPPTGTTGQSSPDEDQKPDHEGRRQPGTSPMQKANAATEVTSNASDGGLQMVSVDAIRPNRRQPRQQFDDTSLESLATSIRSAGVMQPIMLRPAESHIDSIRYELVAGERRWRAAKLAGLDRVPAIVRRIDEATAAEWALIENIQREDLNPIERAEAFRRLSDDFSLTHQDIADRVGLDRSSVTNLLRLLELDPDTIDDVRAGRLSLGHARALLSVEKVSTRRTLARQATRQGWSVRTLERRINAGRSALQQESGASAGATPTQIHLRNLADELGRHLGTRVRIEAGRKKGAGKLIVDFYSLDEFESLLERLGYKPM